MRASIISSQPRNIFKDISCVTSSPDLSRDISLHLRRRNKCIDIVGTQRTLVRAVGLQAGTIDGAVLAALVLAVAAVAVSVKAVKT
jgi:hypothetical protein